MTFHLDEIDPFALIAADSAGLGDAADGNLEAVVESCPGWTVADLVRHVYEVHTFWSRIAERRLTDPDDVRPIDPPPDETLLEDFRSNAERMVQILRAADPADAVWTWSRQRDIAFINRHQVQEAAVHRWDAENAAGRDFHIDTAGAADAVDEFLTMSLADKPDEPLGEAVVLVADGTDAAWTVSPDTAGTVTARRGAVDAAHQVAGTPSDLLLWLFSRRPLSTLRVIGDPATVEKVRAYAATE